MKLPNAIKNLADHLSELPSIGPRQATRLAFYLISRGANEIRGLADAVSDINNIKICSQCFFVHQNSGDRCDICGNPSRRRDVIMIVEKETDLISVENTGKFLGRYFIIGPIPKTGVFEDVQSKILKTTSRRIWEVWPKK